MAKKQNIIVEYLAYVGLRLFAMFVHMFDWQTNYRTARFLGDMIWKYDRRHRNRGLEHLRRSFPGWTPQRYDTVGRLSMRNLMYLGLEILFTVKLITPPRWRRHITLTNMAENIRLLVKRETGLIFITGHFGNWEVVGYTMAALGFPNYAIARRLDNRFVNDYILGIRQNRGMIVLDKKGATESMDEILAQKGAVSFIADQDAGRKGLFVDFFGRPASTYKAPALMAMQYGAPVIVGYGRRLDEEYHFEIGIQRIIYPSEWADKDNPIRWITQEYTKALEDVIRTAPEQYLWVHRRWKHRPKGEEPAPDGIA
jgi:KDO2-lipid IV(A) lauroyltransferase